MAAPATAAPVVAVAAAMAGLPGQAQAQAQARPQAQARARAPPPPPPRHAPPSQGGRSSGRGYANGRASQQQHQHQHQQHQQQQAWPRPQQQQPPPHCTFCVRRNPRDRYSYTHTLKNARGETVCPMLSVIECPMCHRYGHTEHHCPYAGEVLAMEMEEMGVGAGGGGRGHGGGHKRPPAEDGDDEEPPALKKRRPTSIHIAMVADPAVAVIPRRPRKLSCLFCYHVDPRDPIHLTHAAHHPITGQAVCPRLLLTQCTYCKRMGHTPKYCNEKRWDEEVARGEVVLDPGLEVVFGGSQSEASSQESAA